MSTAREVTPADIQEAYTSCAEAAVEFYNRRGEFPPRLLGFALDAEPGKLQTEVVDMPPRMMMELFGKPEHVRQRVTLAMVDELLREGSEMRKHLPEFDKPLPSLAVLITEAWITWPESAQEANDDHAKYGSVEHTPGRGECILVAVYTLEDCIMWQCPVEGTPKRARFERLPDGIIERGILVGPLTNGPSRSIDAGDLESWSTVQGRKGK